MRTMAKFAGVCLIAFALTVLSAAAQTEQKKPPGIAPIQSGMITVKPGGSTRPIKPVGRKTPLTNEECTQLGGTVKEAPVGVCNSGNYCETFDENNHRHNVCI